MLTPKQQALLDRPIIQELIKSLDLQPKPSIELKTNIAIQERVNNLISSFEKALSLPVAARSVSTAIEDTTHGSKIDYRPNTEATFTFKAWTCLAGKTIKAPF